MNSHRRNTMIETFTNAVFLSLIWEGMKITTPSKINKTEINILNKIWIEPIT